MGGDDEEPERIVTWGEAMEGSGDIDAAVFGESELVVWDGEVMVKCCMDLRPEDGARPFGCEVSVFQKRERGGDDGLDEVRQGLLAALLASLNFAPAQRQLTKQYL